jgi:hypothetical protein
MSPPTLIEHVENNKIVLLGQLNFFFNEHLTKLYFSIFGVLTNFKIHCKNWHGGVMEETKAA